MTERSWAEIDGVGTGLAFSSGAFSGLADDYVRGNNADMTVGAPVAYTKYNTVAPDNITAILLSNAAHDPDTAAHTTAYAANPDMASPDHAVYIQIDNATWSATNDFIGVLVRGNSPEDTLAAYGFVVWRDAGPVYNLYRVRWSNGSIVTTSLAGTMASPPVAGSYLGCEVHSSVSPVTLTLKYSAAGGPFTSIATTTTTTVRTGLRGGWTIQQGGAGTALAVEALWLNARPFAALSPDDGFVRPNAADVVTSAPFSYGKLLNAPNDVTAEILSNTAHDPNTAGNATCYRAQTDMVGSNHTVWMRLATAVWNSTNDNIGVVARADANQSDRSFYSFNVVRVAGPAYQPYIYRFDAGAFVAASPAGSNLAAAPAPGDFLSITVSGSTITGQITPAATGFTTTAVTWTDTNVTSGTRGGFYLQRGDATANFAIDGLWLNRSPL